MGENFEAIKKKYFWMAVILSVVLGACCGLILTCVLVVVFKVYAVEFHWAIYIPIALGISALSAVPLFFLLRPNDKKLAKKLDRELGLNQKVQTMVEFADEYSPILELQREQANDVLAEEAVSKKIKASEYLKFIAIPIVALAMLFAGIFVPATKSTYEEPPYDFTQAKETALKNLIENVEKSDLAEDVKTPTVEVLNGLLEGLKETTQQSVMKNAVISSVKIIDSVFAADNSYLLINASFSDDEQLKPLGEALVDCVLFYREGGTKINSFDAVTAKQKQSDIKIDEGLTKWTDEYLKNFVNGEGGDKISVAEASAKLTTFSNALTAKLADLEMTEDKLYLSLSGYGQALSQLAMKTSGMSADSYYRSISGLGEQFVSSAGGALSVQSYNCMMDEYIRAELAKIFDISETEFGGNESVVPPKPGDGDEDGSHQGSPGGGEILYGSDDLVLDVDTGEMVPYGQLLNKYNDMVNEKIASGACSEEVAKYIRQYFRLLYSGIDDKK